jgi:large subunit ribosomal protein L22
MMKYSYAIQGLEESKTSKALGMSLDMSARHGKEVCDLIRGRRADDAVKILESVIAKKMAVPYTRYKHDLPHQTGIGPGRFPVKTSAAILVILKSAMKNAENKSLNASDLVIKHICTHQAARPWHSGRHTRRKMKRAHLEVVLEEVHVPKEETKKKVKEVKDKVPKPVQENVQKPVKASEKKQKGVDKK